MHTHTCIYKYGGNCHLWKTLDRQLQRLFLTFGCARFFIYFISSLVGEVQTKATSLRTQYGKLLRPKPSGSSDKDLTPRQRWILKKLQFLQPFVVPRVSQSTLNVSWLLQLFPTAVKFMRSPIYLSDRQCIYIYLSML